jgi:acetyl esterase
LATAQRKCEDKVDLHDDTDAVTGPAYFIWTFTRILLEKFMPLSRQVAEMLYERRKDPTQPLYELSLEQARAYDLASIRAGGGPVVPVGAARDLTPPGPAGELAARLYRPSGAGPFPVLLYLFGGGWTLGTLDTCDGVCRQLCADASCLVMSVQYRRAPEHRFPAAPEDCYAAARWPRTRRGSAATRSGSASAGTVPAATSPPL